LETLRETWKIDKYETVFYVLVSLIMTPIAFLARYRILRRSSQNFRKMNDHLRLKLNQCSNESQKKLLSLWVDLNSVGIDMTEQIISHIEAFKKFKAMKNKVAKEKTIESIVNALDSSKDYFLDCQPISQNMQKKAELQRRIIELSMKGKEFDKKTVRDFIRAMLIDLAYSYEKGEMRTVATPIEIVLNSRKFSKWICSKIFFTSLLEADANILDKEKENYQRFLKDLMKIAKEG